MDTDNSSLATAVHTLVVETGPVSQSCPYIESLPFNTYYYTVSQSFQAFFIHFSNYILPKKKTILGEENLGAIYLGHKVWLYNLSRNFKTWLY